MAENSLALVTSPRWTASDRVGAVLTGGGISILLIRAAVLISGSRQVLKRWVIDLAALELALDIATLFASVRWWSTNARRHRQLPLRLAAAATVLHAVRVLIFVLGRVRPFKDFDVRPEQRDAHDQRWNWSQVLFAAAMSVLGIVGVLVVRRRIRSRTAFPGSAAGPATAVAR